MLGDPGNSDFRDGQRKKERKKKDSWKSKGKLSQNYIVQTRTFESMIGYK